MEVLLTIKQVAAFLKVNKFTVYRLINSSGLPAFKVGRQWRFKKKAIDEWLEANRSRGEE